MSFKKAQERNRSKNKRPAPPQEESRTELPAVSPEEAVFLVLAEKLRSTNEREEMRARAKHGTEEEFETTLCGEWLHARLHSAVRAYAVEQSVAMLPCLVAGAREANNSALRILHTLAFFSVLRLLRLEEAEETPDILDAAADALLPKLLQQIHRVEDLPEPAAAPSANQ